MKVACDRCERVINEYDEKYAEDWRRVLVYRPRESPINFRHEGFNEPINTMHICPECYDKIVKYSERQYYLEHEGINS